MAQRGGASEPHPSPPRHRPHHHQLLRPRPGYTHLTLSHISLFLITISGHQHSAQLQCYATDVYTVLNFENPKRAASTRRIFPPNDYDTCRRVAAPKCSLPQTTQTGAKGGSRKAAAGPTVMPAAKTVRVAPQQPPSQTPTWKRGSSWNSATGARSRSGFPPPDQPSCFGLVHIPYLHSSCYVRPSFSTAKLRLTSLDISRPTIRSGIRVANPPDHQGTHCPCGLSGLVHYPFTPLRILLQ